MTKVGASPFETYADGTDAGAAFRTARDLALHEHGHGLYSGTILEKHDFVVITRTLMTYDQAAEYADELLHRADPRVKDKWGPAGAIPIKQDTRTVTVDNVSEPGRSTLNPADVDRVARIARHHQLITDGETVTRGRWTSRHGADGRTTVWAAQLTVAKSPAVLAAQTAPDGWLFFGWASA